MTMSDAKPARLSNLDLPRWAIHLAGILPALWIAALWFAGELTINPYQAVEQRTGRIALIFLMLALACTPANLVLGWRQAIRHRRTLGLYAFAWASAHLLILVGLDYGWSFRLLRADLQTKPFIWIGATALLILSALAATSFVVWKRRLGKNWKRLHRLVYVAVLLVVVHFAWARKANLASLSGDIAVPLAAGAIAVILLVLRIPAVRRRISRRGDPRGISGSRGRGSASPSTPPAP
jgi:sulfoxide reductase heme-binding subunit YedZ